MVQRNQGDEGRNQGVFDQVLTGFVLEKVVNISW